MKNKKEFWLLVALLGIQLIIYAIGESFGYRAHFLVSSFDDKIPLIKWFVYFYVIWYPMWILVPYMISFYSKEKFLKYLTTILICIFTTLIIFIIYPTVMAEPTINGTDFTSKLLVLLFELGSPTKCIPSLHVVYAVMFALPLIKEEKIPKYIKVIIYFLVIGIILSTVLIKKHLIYDAISAIILCLVAWWLVNKFKLHKYLEKILYK